MKKLIALLPLIALFSMSIDAQCCGSEGKAGAKPAAECGTQDCGASQAVAKAASGTISTGALVAMMKAKVPMTLVDARKEAKDPLPTAKSLCSKSMGCSETLAKTLGDKNRLVVTYCAGPKCSASAKMAAQLRAAGYANVVEYREGIEGWKAAKASGGCCLESGSKKDCDGGCDKGCDGGGCTESKTGTDGGCTASKTGTGGTCPSTGATAVAKKAAPAMPAANIDAMGLRTLIDAKVPLVIVDARTGKYDDGMRIPGARAIKDCSGSCWSKAETYKNVVKSKDALVVTYCGAKACPLSSMVAKKLRTAGYTNVIEFQGGVADWKKAGYGLVKADAGCCGSGDCKSKAGGCSESKPEVSNTSAKKVQKKGGC